MSEASERLERFLTEVQGCETDPAERLSELDDLEARATAQAEADAAVLSTLGSETRYALVRALVEAGEELCVCELHPLLAVGESAVSHALADLLDAGLVTRRDDGKWRYYEATERAERVLAALDATREGA